MDPFNDALQSNAALRVRLGIKEDLCVHDIVALCPPQVGHCEVIEVLQWWSACEQARDMRRDTSVSQRRSLGSLKGAVVLQTQPDQTQPDLKQKCTDA